MKSIATLGAALLASAAMIGPVAAQDMPEAPAGIYNEDPAHAYITFSYDHQGFSNPVLSWNEFDITVDYDPASLADTSVNVVIQADSIDSGFEDFNGHLTSADFFNVEEYPEITFVSTGLDMTDATTGTLTGDLTIKDNTQPVTLDVTLNKVGMAMDGETPKMGLTATGTVLRSNFGVDAYVPAVSDEVDLRIEIELEKAD